MHKKKLYLIDATALCYRAFYALGALSTSFGQPTNAVYGFLNMLRKIIKEHKPDYLAACFDVSRDTFRLKKFKDYKAQRPPMPDGLSTQIPLIKEIIKGYGIALFEKEGFEADDIIATLAKKARQKALDVVVISSDKDMLQLVDEGVEVYSPYKDEGIYYDTFKVKERFGVDPELIPDIIALMGDSVDNIPGVKGIGEKTAIQLITEYGSLERLLESKEKIKQEKLREALGSSEEMIRVNYELAKLDSGVDIDFDQERLKTGEPDTKELYRIFKQLEFKRFLKELPQGEDESPVLQKAGALEDKELQKLFAGEKELFLYGDSSEALHLGVGENVYRPKAIGKELKRMLADPEIKKTGHDLKKIKVGLQKEGIPLEGIDFDTMIAAYLLNPSRGEYGLSDVAWDYLEAHPASVMSAEKALGLIAGLKAKLAKALDEKSLLKLFTELEIPLVGVLSEMESCGIKIDTGILEGLSKEIEKRLAVLTRDIYRISGGEFNINSPKQLRVVLFEKLKLPVVKRTKTGPSTDEEVLTALAPKNELPAHLLEYRQLSKLKNTYIDTLPELVDKKTGRVHTSFNQTGTETGRLSSSAPNLQNIPLKSDFGRNIRRAIVSSGPQDCLLSCDYSQVELRILAHLSKDEVLIKAFREDKDIHAFTASLVYAADEKDVSPAQRETAKRVNFGIVYGLTSYGLSRDIGLSVNEAQDFIDEYFLRYPKVQVYIQEQIEKARKEGFVTTLLGRRRYLPQINDRNQNIRQLAERQAVNTPLQGSASDLIKLAMVQIHGKLREKKLKARMILQIHDELLFELPKGELKEASALAREGMEKVLKLAVPVKVDIKKGENWLEMEEVK